MSREDEKMHHGTGQGGQNLPRLRQVDLLAENTGAIMSSLISNRTPLPVK